MALPAQAGAFNAALQGSLRASVIETEQISSIMRCWRIVRAGLSTNDADRQKSIGAPRRRR
jgi:hypothetical protein